MKIKCAFQIILFFFLFKTAVCWHLLKGKIKNLRTSHKLNLNWKHTALCFPLQVEGLAMFVFINVSRSPQSPYSCSRPCPPLQAGIWDAQHQQSPWGHPLLWLRAHPSVGAGADPSQSSWTASCCFAGLTQTSQILFIPHCTEWNWRVWCIASSELSLLFSKQRKNKLYNCYCCCCCLDVTAALIHSSFLSWLMSHPTMKFRLSANMIKFQKQNPDQSWVARSKIGFISYAGTVTKGRSHPWTSLCNCSLFSWGNL